MDWTHSLSGILASWLFGLGAGLAGVMITDADFHLKIYGALLSAFVVAIPKAGKIFDEFSKEKRSRR